MAEKPKRKGISKAIRFSIFSRDGFTCRYCGRQSDVVVLVIDHVIPVCQGGTNDPENLITACDECNSGKGGRTPTQSAPNETDRLRISQEFNEQIKAAEAAKAAVESRKEYIQEIINLWCEIRGTEQVDMKTIHTIARYAEESGVSVVSKWIEMAHCRFPWKNDTELGKYISGIRRRIAEDAQ